jgi:hypothetical protein
MYMPAQGRDGLVIFDHPHIAEYLRLSRWAEISEYHARSSSYVPSQRPGGSGITGGHGFALRQTCLPAAAHPWSNATPADGSERASPFRRGLGNSRSPAPQIFRVQCETGELRSRHAEHRDRCTRTETDTHDVASGGSTSTRGRVRGPTICGTEPTSHRNSTLPFGKLRCVKGAVPGEAR